MKPIFLAFLIAVVMG